MLKTEPPIFLKPTDFRFSLFLLLFLKKTFLSGYSVFTSFLKTFFDFFCFCKSGYSVFTFFCVCKTCLCLLLRSMTSVCLLVVFRTRGNNAVCSVEGWACAQSENRNRGFGFKKTNKNIYILNRKPKSKLRFRDEENRKPSNFQISKPLHH